jgi:predicted TPR repeat methyltransferase
VVLTEASVAAAYDAVAERYTALYANQISADATERWVIDQFGQLCRDTGNEMIVDLGCGPGRIAAHLADAGNRVMGVDVSAEMIRIARSRSPQVEFQVESMASFLQARPDSIGNALFWYSAIHTAPDELAALMRTTFAAVRTGGYILLGFQSMADPAAATETYDHRVVSAYRYSLAEVHRRLLDVGFSVLHLGLRAPGPEERVPAGYALARKPSPA